MPGTSSWQHTAKGWKQMNVAAGKILGLRILILFTFLTTLAGTDIHTKDQELIKVMVMNC